MFQESEGVSSDSFLVKEYHQLCWWYSLTKKMPCIVMMQGINF